MKCTLEHFRFDWWRSGRARSGRWGRSLSRTAQSTRTQPTGPQKRRSPWAARKLSWHRQWRVVPAPVPNAHIQAVGADWIEYWVPNLPGRYPQFVFQNIYTGQTRTLAGWHAGGRIVPNLNSRALGQRLCAPLRVPDAWEDTGVTDQDFPGTLSSFGRYAVVGGDNRQLSGSAYLERCGTARIGGSARSGRSANQAPRARTRTRSCGRRRRTRRVSTCRASRDSPSTRAARSTRWSRDTPGRRTPIRSGSAPGRCTCS